MKRGKSLSRGQWCGHVYQRVSRVGGRRPDFRQFAAHESITQGRAGTGTGAATGDHRCVKTEDRTAPSTYKITPPDTLTPPHVS